MAHLTINEGTLVTSASPVTAGWVRNVLTFQDCYARAVAFLRAFGHDLQTVTTGPPELLRGIISDAYETILNAYDWPTLEGMGRIPIQPQVDTGTVAYTSATRTLAITAGTWPAWAEGAAVRIGDHTYQVQSRVSSASLILDEQLCPADDIAAGTDYKLFRWFYTLPRDFGYLNHIMLDSGAVPDIVPLGMIQHLYQRDYGTGDVSRVAFGQHPQHPHRQALFVWPPTTEEEKRIDFTYTRRPRDWRFSGYDAADTQGTVSVTAASNAVTGSSTAFTDEMEGAMLRWGRTSSIPTGTHGGNRYAEQQYILSVSSATELVLLGSAVATRSAVGYVVTDPLGIDPVANRAVLAEIEHQLALAYRSGHVGSYEKAAEKALRLAAQAAQSHGPLTLGSTWRLGAGVVEIETEDD